MKKPVLIIMLLAITGSTFGVIFGQFRSWSTLNDLSSDIIIARCIATPHFTAPGMAPKIVVENGGVTSDIEVLKVLKGDTKTGLSQMGSFYSPCQGEAFLAFGRHAAFGTNSWYNVVEEYRVIPLNRDFRMSDLDGKTLNEQIQLIFKSRLKDLNDEMARDKEEKARLESGLRK